MHLTVAEARAYGLDVPKKPDAKRFNSGKRADLDNRYFRSAWEANYARYLNWLIAQGIIDRWEYEVETFEFPVKKGNRFYTPDFKVWSKDGTFEFHEMKGWMDRSSRTKLARMKKHHPTVKVLVIDSKQYRAIARKMAPMVPNWETNNDAQRRSLSDLMALLETCPEMMACINTS